MLALDAIQARANADDIPVLIAELWMLRDACTDLIKNCRVDDTPYAHDALTQLAQLGVPVWQRRGGGPVPGDDDGKKAVSRLSDIIASGNNARIIGIALHARSEADAGRYCECEQPALTGLDLMCGECLLENLSQREKKTVWIRAPHEFVPSENDSMRRMEMCGRCSGWLEDPRHVAGRGGGPVTGDDDGGRA